MRIVVDSSVAVKWYVAEPFREQAAAFLDGEDELLAPDILLAEVGNALWRKVRKAELGSQQAAATIEELSSIMTLSPLTSRLTQDAFKLGQDLGHSIYDCLFLAHALNEGVPLVTADEKFAAKASPLSASIRALGAT